jgi:hypothetical protein
LKTQKVFESAEFAVLHLSSAIADLKQGKRTKVYARHGKDPEVCVAALSDQTSQVALDLYINCTQ